MWRTITYCAIVLAFAVMIGTELLRSVVHKYREKKHGIGGTQDIAMYGTFLGWSLLIIGALAGILSFYRD